MNIEHLKDSVTRFRAALDECHAELGLVGFEWFPIGCCGVSSELLATFLWEEGQGVFAYVSGWTINLDQSHAWLEKEDWIVDVTRDQFQADLAFVSQDTSLSNAFPERRKRRPDGNFRLLNAVDDLEQAYAVLRHRSRESR